jgi:hypothetical protein
MRFKKNVGTLDMIIRLLMAAGLFYIGFFMNPIISEEDTSKLIVGLAGLLPLTTGLLRYCPLYSVINVSTCSRSSQPSND